MPGVALTEGPLGFPQTDEQAKELEGLLKEHSKDSALAYRKQVVEKATTELSPGERADVSWISTEAVDRARDVVLARGLDDSHYQLNPIVTLQHCYWLPAVGKSLWRKKVKDGERRGVKAKTVYPPRPDGFADQEWPPDSAFELVKAGLLNGKSIGFLPLSTREPSPKEREQEGWGSVGLIIEEWLLLEYACVMIPCQQEAVTVEVSKSFRKALNLPETLPAKEPAAVKHCTARQIAQALQARVARFDWERLANESVKNAIERRQGRV